MSPEAYRLRREQAAELPGLRQLTELMQPDEEVLMVCVASDTEQGAHYEALLLLHPGRDELLVTSAWIDAVQRRAIEEVLARFEGLAREAFARRGQALPADIRQQGHRALLEEPLWTPAEFLALDQALRQLSDLVELLHEERDEGELEGLDQVAALVTAARKHFDRVKAFLN